jgi:hypothetical protein
MDWILHGGFQRPSPVHRARHPIGDDGLVRQLAPTSFFSSEIQSSIPCLLPMYIDQIAISFSLEWWSFELLVLLSGLLPNPKLETSVLSIW